MDQLKVTSWNIEHLDTLLKEPSSPQSAKRRDRRLNAISEEIHQLDPDVLCVVEGPTPDRIDLFAEVLGGNWVPVKSDTSNYATKGAQYIWFLVREEMADIVSLQSPEIWDNFTESKWPVHYWGVHSEKSHSHYRHPQVLVMDWHGLRVEFIGLHLKSKFAGQYAESDWAAGGDKKNKVVEESLKARIKLATEASNVRSYINAKFDQVSSPAIFVMGDLNDGPGKEYFEKNYLFFDLLSNIQGDVFFARRFLNHALFDFADDLRWSIMFDDFVDPSRDPHILLDHILFTQGLVDGSLPLLVGPEAGFVEHETHELINAVNPQYARTSDHRPLSLLVDIVY